MEMKEMFDLYAKIFRCVRYKVSFNEGKFREKFPFWKERSWDSVGVLGDFSNFAT